MARSTINIAEKLFEIIWIVDDHWYSWLREVHSLFQRQFSHRRRYSVSSFNLQYPIFSLRPSSSCLRILPCLLITSLRTSTFPSIACFRKPFLRKMWPIQLAFLQFIVCRMFLSSLTPCNTSFLTWQIQLSPLSLTTAIRISNVKS